METHETRPLNLTVQAAVAVIGLCLAAATAGYQVGHEIGEALDDNDETEPAEGDGNGGGDDGGDDDGDQARRSQIRLNLRDHVLTLEVAAETTAGKVGVAAPEVTIQESLARLKRDREATLRMWRSGRGGRIVSPAFAPAELSTLIGSAVTPDGQVDLAAFGSATPTGVASLGPLGAAVLAVAGAALLSFAVGVAVGLAVETLGDDAEDTEGGDEGDGGDDGGGDDTSDTGSGNEGSRSVTGTLRPGDGIGIDLRVRRTATDARPVDPMAHPGRGRR